MTKTLARNLDLYIRHSKVIIAGHTNPQYNGYFKRLKNDLESILIGVIKVNPNYYSLIRQKLELLQNQQWKNTSPSQTQFEADLRTITELVEQCQNSISDRETVTINEEYEAESYKFISSRVYLCFHLGIIDKLLQHFSGDDNKQLIDFLFDLGIFTAKDKRSTIQRAIKEIVSQKGKLYTKNYNSIAKEYPKLDKSLLK